VFTGASRQGKTHQLKKRIRRSRRVLVWSIKEKVDRYADTWTDAVTITGLQNLLDYLRTIGKKPAHIVYIPRSISEFGQWAKLAHAWGMLAPCDVVAEELADVTSPAKAPAGWGELCRQGLGWGINIYAVTQRPAESDKTIMGNATFFHVHYMSRANDRKYMANEMDIDPALIAGLKKYDWIEKTAGEQKIKRGR
jgi:hypothetical protein